MPVALRATHADARLEYWVSRVTYDGLSAEYVRGKLGDDFTDRIPWHPDTEHDKLKCLAEKARWNEGWRRELVFKDAVRLEV
jgi:hypothetical protein